MYSGAYNYVQCKYQNRISTWLSVQSPSSHSCQSTVQSSYQTVLFIRWYNIITLAMQIKYNSMNTSLIDINQWNNHKQYLVLLSHKKRLYIKQLQVLTVHPGASYPLFSVSRGLCEHSLLKSLSWGSSTASHPNTFTPRGYKAPYRSQSQQKAVQPWQNVCHKTRPTTGLRSDQHLTSNWLPNN